ncbi:MAG TPA: MFS transporter [Acidimicrobiales bacterium]|nr:MFS transporter [Acidimicrobiales bacterium]
MTVTEARAGARARHGAVGALRHRDFALFWTTALVSNSAAWMQMVAVPAKLWKLTGSATWLGAASMASLLPAVLLTPLAGVLADRTSRRLILIVTQNGQMLFAFAFWVLYLADELTPWRMLGLLLGNGVVSGIQVAAWQSFVPTLVPREDLIDAVRLNSVQFQAARAIGPGVGALAVSFFGIGTAFLLNAVTFVPVVIAVMVARPRQAMSARAGEPMRHALAEGFRYTWSRSALRRAVLTALAVSAMGQMVIALAAGISGEIYGHSGTGGNAGLVAALGAGSLVSGLFILTRGDRIARSHMAIVGLAIYVVGILLVPLTTSYRVGMVAFAVCGLAHIPVATSLNTFVQSSVPDEIRGRVLSFYLLGVMIGMPTGALLLGRIGDLIGLRETLVLDAIAFAAFFTIIVLRFGRLQFVDRESLDETDTASRVGLAVS